MKRITIFRNGSNDGGRLFAVPNLFGNLLENISAKLDMSVVFLYTGDGAIVDDAQLIRDGDILFASSGEPFCASRVDIPTGSGDSSTSGLLTSHQMSAPIIVDSSWVTLNVGGKYFTTSRSTLTDRDPNSMLAKMFSENAGHTWKNRMDNCGAFLVDRSPTYFEPVLNYLRHGQLILDKNVNPQGVLEEAKFFGIASLVEELEAVIQDDVVPSDVTPINRREFVLRLMATPSHCELRCQGVNFSGANLSRLDLRYINFKHANLRKSNLSGANLSYCNFERADMSSAVLDGANLLGAKMLCVSLEGGSLQGCNFEDPAGSRANMEGANMKSVNLEGSHMAAVNLRVANLKNANLQNCDLRGAVLAGADLENCDLSGCDLQEANLRGANLKGAAFELMLNPLHMSQAVR